MKNDMKTQKKTEATAVLSIDADGGEMDGSLYEKEEDKMWYL